MNLKALQTAAILSIAVYLVPLGAHLFELPAKMRLTPAEYMTVQRIYAGWALFAIVIAIALALTLWHTLRVRGTGLAFTLSLLSFLALAATQALFWTYTQPMNAASNNWTTEPPEFEMARMSWEYSHAASAVLTFLALAAIVVSALTSRDRLGSGHG